MGRIVFVVALSTIAMGAVADERNYGPRPLDGTKLLFRAEGKGVQIYECRAQKDKFQWAFIAPEAALYGKDGRQIGKHFAGPTWQAEDGSKVTGQLLSKADAPDGHSVPWLLLKAASHEGDGTMSRVDTIRRLMTKGGAAPAGGCDAGHVGETARVSYSAEYEFYAAR